jgi:hypothetical protein
VITNPAGPGTNELPPAKSYSRVSWRTLILVALIIAFLPIPVALLQLMPTFRVQAQFLMFVAPLVCIFILAYMVSVRDSLARAVAADILHPSPHHHWYHRAGLRRSLRRRLSNLRRPLFSLLPALLFLTALWCALQYTATLSDSVDLATRAWAARVSPDEEVGLAHRGTSARPDDSSAGEEPTERRSTATTAQPSRSQLRPTREFVLRNATISDIPSFLGLSALYTGVFVSALLAMVLLALKEYARDALRLTEEDLVLRKTHDSDT